MNCSSDNPHNHLPQPVMFKPLVKPVIWGGDYIRYFKGLHHETSAQIGESWEVSGIEGDESVVSGGQDDGLMLHELIDRYGAALVGETVYKMHGNRFPVLVKYIDAARDLSVQVHPDDAMAAELGLTNGKNEMWHIMRSSGGAKIYAGFRNAVDCDTLNEAVEDKSVMDLIKTHRSRPGDTFILPAGTIHAIGAGNFLLEVQQASDVTYRVYDYDRRDASGSLRELHTDLARRALKFDACDVDPKHLGRRPAADTLLVDAYWARVIRHQIDGERVISFPLDSFTLLCCIEGEMTIKSTASDFVLKAGQTCLVPAIINHMTFTGRGAVVSVTAGI